MPTAIEDRDEDDRRAPLPDSVDRVLGKALEGSPGGAIDLDALKRVDLSSGDSNLDRVHVAFGLDVLVDGTLAVKAIVEALERRLSTPVVKGEKLRLVPSTR
jgi:hypothetical protein